MAAAVAQWRHDWHAPAGDLINPMQVARLGMVIARALGHDIEEVFPKVDCVQGCVEAELLADRGASMERRDRAFRDSRMRSLHLRHALQLVALARDDPKWEDY